MFMINLEVGVKELCRMEYGIVQNPISGQASVFHFRSSNESFCILLRYLLRGDTILSYQIPIQLLVSY